MICENCNGTGDLIEVLWSITGDPPERSVEPCSYCRGSGRVYPEHDKLAKIADKSQAIGEFLEWCDEQGWDLATYTNDSACMTPIRFAGGPRNDQEVLARYFDIDRQALEAEKVAMLDAQRELNRKMDEARSGT